jgi:hypothetical protein
LYFTQLNLKVPGTGTLVRTLVVHFPNDIADAKEEVIVMWISLFAVVAGLAICLSVAAVMMQPAAERTYRG